MFRPWRRIPHLLCLMLSKSREAVGIRCLAEMDDMPYQSNPVYVFQSCPRSGDMIALAEKNAQDTRNALRFGRFFMHKMADGAEN